MITTLLERRSSVVNPRHPGDPALADMFSLGYPTSSKIDVTPDSALRFATVYAAVRIISETIASLPVHIYERLDGGGRSKVTQHPLNWLLSVEANDDMSAMMFRETHCQHTLLSGNGFARIIKNGKNEPDSLEIRDWHSVRVGRTGGGRLQYETQLDDGVERLTRDEMLHIPGLATDGILGKSPITLAAEAVGMGMAAQKFSGAFFGNAARPSVVVTMPPGVKMSDVAYKKLMDNWNTQWTGENAWLPAVLEMGADVKPISIPMKDAETVALLKMSVAEIARIYRIPPHMLGEMDKATFSNIEQQSLDFEKHTIRPWLVRIEQEYNRKLFSERRSGRLFVKHSVEGLLRGDVKTRFEAYQTAFINGWMSVNEIRDLEDMNPIEQLGDVHFVAVNLQTLERAVTAPPEEPAEPAPVDEPEPEPDEDRSATRRYLEHLLSETVGGLVQREAYRAKEYAKNPQTFIAKVDGFYAEQAAAMLEKLGAAHADVVTGHVEASKRMLLTAAECPASKLVESVEQTVSNWPERATALAEQIMGGFDGT